MYRKSPNAFNGTVLSLGPSYYSM